MKVNEAPEKIYIHPDIGGREFLRPWLRRAANNESIEYTRTDAFIEKAAKWLEDNAIEYWGTEAVDNGMMIEDFKKYMKGEEV